MTEQSFPPSPRPSDPPGDWSFASSPDVLPSHPEDDGPKARGRGRWLIVGGIGVLTLALVAGVAFAVGRLSGGGAQPEEALPGGAIAFAKVDLDPSVGQKLDAVRFARKFPALRKEISADSDLRKDLYEALADEAGWSNIDYATEVEPWMGQRVGIAVYPAKGKEDGAIPDVIVALQVTDESAARKGLERLKASAEGGEQVGYVIVGDYALLTATDDASRRAAAEATRLADDENFKSDMAALGDGIAAAWMDVAAASAAGGGLFSGLGSVSGINSMAGGTTGRATYVLRFDGADVLEVEGKLVDSSTTVKDPQTLKRFGKLPSGSVAAAGIADGDKLVPQGFEEMRKAMAAAATDSDPVPEESFDDAVASAEEYLGVQLPEDLATLMGSEFSVALAQWPGEDAETIEVGARSTTDPDAALAIMDKVQQSLIAGNDSAALPIVTRKVADGIIVASSDEQADRLAAEGSLDENPIFKKALPDAGNANGAFWVDLAAVIGGVAGADADENLKPLLALGATAAWEEDGSGTFRLRLLAK